MRAISSAIPTLVVSAILATSLTGCQLFDSSAADTREIVIGADLEISGAAAEVGQAYERALRLKVEQINDSGMLGDRKVRLEVKDNRFDPSVSASNIGDFTSDPAISAIIMGSCNECGTGAAKTINDRRVPTIALAPASAVAEARGYMFKLGPNARDNAAAMVVELQQRKAEKVALLHTDDRYGHEGLETLRVELDKIGIELVDSRAVKPTDTEVGQAARALVDPEDSDDKPDTLLVWTGAEQANSAASASRAAGFRGTLFFDAVAAGDLFVGGKSHAAENATMVFTQTMVIDDIIATTPAKAARKQWFNDYTARFGGYNGGSSFAADALQLIADAHLRAGGPADRVNRNGIRDVLETSQLDGLSGPIRMTPDNHSGLMPQALTTLVARNGRWRLAG